MQRATLGFAAGVAALALVASPAAAPVRHSAAVTLKSAKFTSTWRLSHFVSGKLTVTGTAQEPTTLNFGWFAKSLLTLKKPKYGASGPVTGHVSVKKGKFKKSIKFRTALYPGSFVLMGYASGASGVVSFPGRYVKMPAPREGIVITSKGLAVGRGAVIARFTFAIGALPKTSRVVTTWTDPGGKSFRGTLATRRKVESHVTPQGNAHSLRPGVWRCVLSAFGRPLAVVKITVH